MNGIVIVLIAAVLLVAGYVLYGRWLAKSWGIDPKALTPAKRMEDDKIFTPALHPHLALQHLPTNSARFVALALLRVPLQP